MNTAPVVQMGPNLTGDLSVYRNSAVPPYGDQSYDVDAQPLTYAWNIVNKPDNSGAVISAEKSKKQNSYFIPDVTGMYQVQLVVADGSESDVGTLNIEVNDRAPQVNIISHTNNESITPEGPVTLQGSVNDPEDGKLADASIKWISDVDGILGNGETNSVILTSGTHTITLVATDDYNHTSQISLIVNVLEPEQPPENPVVTISSPSNNQAFPSNGNIVFIGSATDGQDNAITGDNLEWILNQDVIGTGKQIEIKISTGAHVITLRATDTNGLQGLARINVQVKANQAPQVSITKPTESNFFLKNEEIAFEGSAFVDHQGLHIGNSTADLVELPHTIVDGLQNFMVMARVKIDELQNGGSRNVLLNGATEKYENAFLLEYRNDKWRVYRDGLGRFFSEDNMLTNLSYHNIALSRKETDVSLYIDNILVAFDI